jgi:hypothetical protein
VPDSPSEVNISVGVTEGMELGGGETLANRSA